MRMVRGGIAQIAQIQHSNHPGVKYAAVSTFSDSIDLRHSLSIDTDY